MKSVKNDMSEIMHNKIRLDAWNNLCFSADRYFIDFAFTNAKNRINVSVGNSVRNNILP